MSVSPAGAGGVSVATGAAGVSVGGGTAVAPGMYFRVRVSGWPMAALLGPSITNARVVVPADLRPGQLKVTSPVACGAMAGTLAVIDRLPAMVVVSLMTVPGR